MKVENYIDNVDTDTVNYSIDNESYIEDYNQYSDFRFITEVLPRQYEGPIKREVSFVSAGWNFAVLFVVMSLIVMNKYISPQKISSIITMPFQSSNEKMIRENHSFLGFNSLSTLISFVLLISLLIQKIYVILGGNQILHENFDFYTNVAIVVAAVFVYDYLLTLFYSWLFKTEYLLVFHVSLHVSSMAACTVLFVPLMMVLLFYPSKLLLILGLILLSIFFIIRFVKLLIEVRMLLKVDFVNIFLYLCTVEILPILVISKMILTSF